MISPAERITARSLRDLLGGLRPDEERPAGGPLDAADDPSAALGSGLEWFLPEILGQAHGFWETASLDGVFTRAVKRIGSRSADVVGTAILLEDQAVVPVHVRLSHHASRDEIDWMEARVGVATAGREMLRLEYGSKAARDLEVLLPELVDRLDWAFTATYGDPPEDHGAVRRCSEAESETVRCLRALLALAEPGGEPSGAHAHDDLWRGLEYGLNRLLPEFFGGTDPVWKWIALDGFSVRRVRKLGACTAEVVGVVDLLPDCLQIPALVRSSHCASRDEVAWLECRITARNQRELRWLPTALREPERVPWSHTVVRGERPKDLA
jgi:hypothetical protein